MLGVALGGCGGDDEGRVEQETSGTQAATGTAPAETAPVTTAPEREETVTVPEDDLTTTSPEESPGGAGDEEPAASQALFTGRGGAVGPAVVRVVPFIAIRVVLRSADGRPYTLRFAKGSLSVGGGCRSDSSTFDGLRPGRRLVGIGTSRVLIEASAEPGP